MTPRLTESEARVYFLLRKFRVRKHYRASSADKVPRYAVFANGVGQVTKPAPFVVAQEEALCLTARAIADAGVG